MVYGYPEGGTSLSITKGIVSRIEFVPYNPPTAGLRIQVDAAINPGNSGGPAVVGDHMIGLAFSKLTGGAENIGYIIPGEEIELFLADIADGKYDGKPAMFDHFQTLENPALRAFLKLDKSVEGSVVHQPESDAADYPLKEWDVVTKIGDTPMDDQGMVRLGDLRVNFTYMVQKIARDGKVPLTLVRAGKEMTVELPVAANRAGADPADRRRLPVVFRVRAAVVHGSEHALSRRVGGYAQRYLGALVYRGSPLVTRLGRQGGVPRRAAGGGVLAVLSRTSWPRATAARSRRWSRRSTASRSRTSAIWSNVLRDCKDEFITVEFDGRGGETVVFPRAEMVSATDDILTDNGVRSQGSPDMLKIWNDKK